MKYYSLADKNLTVEFAEAAIKGQAPNKSLFFPHDLPKWDESTLSAMKKMGREELALKVMWPYVEGSLEKEELKEIIENAFNFPAPLVELHKGHYVLELFHGPSLAFKDFGARFMSRVFSKLNKNRKEKLVVLVATSGDTGGAVALGFYEVPNVEVVILYPEGKVSEVQEKQLTSLGKNIHALRVKGAFDDCQRMVKEAFSDTELQKEIALTSANSINVARWLPQQVYYAWALQAWEGKNLPVFSVPSGNLGNAGAGLLVHFSGLPSAHFILACNANDTVPRFFETGEYEVHPPVSTPSNAMDVADPSNFPRVMELLRLNNKKPDELLSSVSISDQETLDTIQMVYDKFGYILCPHTAVGYLALEKYRAKNQDIEGITLATAHPVKFSPTVEPLIGKKVPLPSQMTDLMEKPSQFTSINNNYSELKKQLLYLAG